MHENKTVVDGSLTMFSLPATAKLTLSRLKPGQPSW